MNPTKLILSITLFTILIIGAMVALGCGGDKPAADDSSKDVASASDNGQNSDQAAVSEATYVCPMHHDQTSTDPDAKCPICNMNMKLMEHDVMDDHSQRDGMDDDSHRGGDDDGSSDDDSHRDGDGHGH